MRLGRRTSRLIVVATTDHHGIRRPILVQFLLLLSSLSSPADMTDRHRHNSPSRVSIPKHLISWNLVTRTTSLIFMTNQKDGPSWICWSITHSVTPHMVWLPHLSLEVALQCHLRTAQAWQTITCSLGGTFVYFSVKNLRILLLDRFPANKEKLT